MGPGAPNQVEEQMDTLYGLHYLHLFTQSRSQVQCLQHLSQAVFATEISEKPYFSARAVPKAAGLFFCRLSLAPSVWAVLGFIDRAPGLGRIVEVVDDGYNPLSLGILQLFVAFA